MQVPADLIDISTDTATLRRIYGAAKAFCLASRMYADWTAAEYNEDVMNFARECQRNTGHSLAYEATRIALWRAIDAASTHNFTTSPETLEWSQMGGDSFTTHEKVPAALAQIAKAAA